MGPVDIIILALIAAGVAGVCLRVHRKGTCADCAQAGTCTGHCSDAERAVCPALKGVDAVADELGRGLK